MRRTTRRLRPGWARTLLLGLVLVPMAGCDAGDSDTSHTDRPAGILPTYEARLNVDHDQMISACTQGPQANGLECSNYVAEILETLDELRAAIESRPDADSYPDTLAEIGTVDGLAEDYELSQCWGTIEGSCSLIANDIRLGLADVYEALQYEDAPAPR